MSKQPNRKRYMVLFPKTDFVPQYHRPGDNSVIHKLRFVREEEGRIVNIGEWHDLAFADACIRVYAGRSNDGPHFVVDFEWADVWSLNTRKIKAIAAFNSLVNRRLEKMEREGGSPNGPVDRFNRILKAIGVELCARYVNDSSSSYSDCTFRFGDRDAACQMFGRMLGRMIELCDPPAES